jgi:hypothetical protein
MADQQWSTWVSLKVLAREHLDQPQGSWVCDDLPKCFLADLKTLRLTQVYLKASRYLDQLCKTWVSLKVFRLRLTQ